MAKVSTKRRKEVDNIFGDNPLNNSFSAYKPGGDDPKNEPENKGPTVEQLQAQIADMNRKFDTMERTNLALMTQAPQIEQRQQQQTQVKDADLPDPTLDPVGYSKAIEARADRRINDFITDQRTKSDEASKGKQEYETVWNAFSTKYEDYAGDNDKLEFVTTRVLNDAKALGIDPKKYMTVSRERFFDDVVKKYDDVFGKPEGDGEETTQRDEPAQRTMGIFGGLDSGGKPVASGKDQAGDMITDLQAMQKKSGFY